jgi:hypothetical protein
MSRRWRTYLSGVIAKELFNEWSVATHRAQAIAARSCGAVCEMDDVAHAAASSTPSAGEIGPGLDRRDARTSAASTPCAATRGRGASLRLARGAGLLLELLRRRARAPHATPISTSVVNDIAPLSVSRLGRARLLFVEPDVPLGS